MDQNNFAQSPVFIMDLEFIGRLDRFAEKHIILNYYDAKMQMVIHGISGFSVYP